MAEIKALGIVSGIELIQKHNWACIEVHKTGCIELHHPIDKKKWFHLCGTYYENLKDIMFFYDDKKGWSPVR